VIGVRARWATAVAPLRARWRAMAARDRRLLALTAGVLGLYLLWVLAVQPAWRTLSAAPAQIDALDAQLQQMQAQAVEARELRAAPALSAQQAGEALKAACDRLGPKARLVLQGDRAVVNVNGVGGGELREWLAEVRAGARARPVDVQLVRNPQGFAGTVVLALGGAK
jgi:general secretion pathway protein M